VAPRSEDPKLIIRVINFELVQPICPRYVNGTDRRTDGRTDRRLTIAIPRFALRASRGKNDRSTSVLTWKRKNFSSPDHTRAPTQWPTKAAGRNKMSFGRDTHVVPSNVLLDRGPSLATERKDFGVGTQVRSDAALPINYFGPCWHNDPTPTGSKVPATLYLHIRTDICIFILLCQKST